jgi:8-oxo-dGTP diphosphatase
MTDFGAPDPSGFSLAAVEAAAAVLPAGQQVLTPSPAVARTLSRAGHRVTVAAPDRGAPGGADAVVLAADELTVAGDGAEELLAAAADATRPGGLLVVTAVRSGATTAPAGERPGPAPRETPPPRTGPRSFADADIAHLLHARGVAVESLREVDARAVASGRVPASEAARNQVFMSHLPLKLLSAATLVRDDEGQVLCVYDTFRQHWTVPGGIVDAGEDPRAAAVRESEEEGGVRVRAGALLGVFSLAVPDRTLLLYEARPLDPDDPAVREPVTSHPHEVGEVVWLPLEEALARVNWRTRWQLERCLAEPGETWIE